MSLGIASPRLLPVTIFAIASLLAVKSVDLVRAAAPAQAAEPPHASNPAEPPHASNPAEPPHASNPAEPPHASDAAEPSSPGGAARPGAPAAKRPLETKSALDRGALSTAMPSSEPPVSDSERTLLLELRQRRQELEARDAALAAREAVLSAAEGKLSARVNELQALQSRLEALESARKSHDEENWRGLVKLYESMKPREAAAIFNDLDMHVLLQVVDRMKEAKAAAVLAAMQPDKARQVTTELAQMRTSASSDPKPGTGG